MSPFFIAAGSRIDSLLNQSVCSPTDTRILLSHGLGLSRVQLITQSERIITKTQAQQLTTLFQRRLQGEPIAYIIGQREFYGLTLRVTPDVLIPRPETELLVELALKHLPKQGRLLDLGTGSGAIAIAIAHTRPDACVTALDFSPAALAIARHNAAQHKTPITFLQSHWYEALTAPCFDIIVANPPYIRAGDIHLTQGDLRFEPLQALTDHADGLSALRAIIAGAPAHLRPDGWLLLEHGYDQAGAVRHLLQAKGWHEIQSWQDLSGIERVSGAVKRP